MEIDEKYMRRALQLARLGNGNVSPNPMVGAVIVCDGKIIGEGFHRRFGEGHAEVNAVASVADESLLSRSTIYVTLEPCSHYGKTPPCSLLLIRKHIPRVVVGSLDPFAKVSGRGVKMLRDAGVEVVTGVLESECRALNVKFITAHSLRRPYIMLKWAQSHDGFIDTERSCDEVPAVISNSLTAMWMHRERSRFDAVLVGAGTVVMDNPSLTVRHWRGRQPLRVVLDANLSAPVASHLFTDGLTTIVYNAVRDGRTGAVCYVKTDSRDPMIWLRDLYNRGVTSLMVEGGACVLKQLIDSMMWDEARIEIGDISLEKGVKAPIIKGFITKNESHGDNKIIFEVQNVKTENKPT